MRMLWVRGLAGCALTAVFAWSVFWSVRLAEADYWARQETVSGTEKALALTPGQAEYHVRMAKLLADSNPMRARAHLQEALALDLWDASSWIDLGFSHEAAGEFQEAEDCMLHAAAIDRQYLPRWTLANYYFRRGDQAKFWQWAKSAANMIYGDPLPLFRLCGMATEDGNLIERLGIRKPELRAQYLGYLLDGGYLALTGPAVRAVLASGREEDVPLLLAVCDRLLSQGREEEALKIWNALAAVRRIPYEPLDPHKGRVVTNGGFAVAPAPHGFDWRVPQLEGVSASEEESPRGLRLTFSGRQPEACEPLMQLIPVEEAAAYDVSFRYRTSSIPPDSGLRWRVTDEASHALLAESAALSSDEPAEGGLWFRALNGSRVVRLTLTYQRQPGTVRFEGYLVLFHVSVRPEPGWQGAK